MTVSSLRSALCLLALGASGCAAPFTEIDPGEKHAGELALLFCGCSTATAGDVIRTMDEPPVGPGGASSNSSPSHLTVCMQVTNKGSAPARVDRSHVRLDTTHERDMWTPDKEDEVFIVPPGEIRKFHVSFEISSPLLSGEDAKVNADTAVTVNGAATRFGAIKLRHK
jgi:hypothetical protein